MNTPTNSTWDPQLTALAGVLKEGQFSAVHILTDSHTHQACLPKLLDLIPELESAVVHQVPAGEHHKSLTTAEGLWTALNEKGADRNTCLIALGGGVITDLGGFVAATFRRGMPFILIPTSLLAMVDAAIGGKTGVNLGSLKNHVGVFAAPRGIYVSPEFLGSLDRAELSSGFAEMLKHGLISDAAYWEECVALNAPEPSAMGKLIARSIQIKEEVVAKDPREKHLRKSLNFGHTVGHALESISLSSNSPLLHGEAVALGMIAESILSTKKGYLPAEKSRECIDGIRKFFPDLRVESSPAEWWPYMLKDKKNQGTDVRCVLLSAIGEPKLDVSISKDDLDGLHEAMNESAR